MILQLIPVVSAEWAGNFYPPTILADVTPGMPAFDEELFGPVTAVITAIDEEEAVRMANLSCYGLGASLWTTDLERGERSQKPTRFR